MARGGGDFGVVGWLVILVIAFFLLPQLVGMLFGGIAGLGSGSQRALVASDPVAAADAVLSYDILQMGKRQ
jgi:hypothetical protein